ncbi:Putative Cytochrome b561 homolog 2 [Serratia symbiotica SCt-VLC]|uniref:Putative Cytochrome b561 homolog 2 n=1 Tax=Serratia symbiotica SCt-VLC TaxID=1347341 RepID=A0A068R9X6_9GAMM|nr:Putative Cytochrome b561 homolog 2 [Serratia symbiotica SCt-VLC]
MSKVNKNDALEKHRRKLRSISVLIHALAALIAYIMFAFGLWRVTQGYYYAWYHQAQKNRKGIGILLTRHRRFTRISSSLIQPTLYVMPFSILINGYLFSPRVASQSACSASFRFPPPSAAWPSKLALLIPFTWPGP